VTSAQADSPVTGALQRAAALLRAAQSTVVLTGAGISTESGIPDFRSPESGLWKTADPIEVASLIGFRRNPQHFYEWVRPLVRNMLNAEPNPAHYALAQLEEMGLLTTLITQNIDMLHERAGSRHILELHGHLRTATCVECFRKYPVDGFLDRFLETGELPRCPHDNGLLKPDVVLFGEALPFKELQAARRVAQEADLMLVAGSSLEVAPASELPLTALAYGARLIIVNIGRTYLDDQADVVIHENAATVLPAILALLVQGKRERLP